MKLEALKKNMVIFWNDSYKGAEILQYVGADEEDADALVFITLDHENKKIEPGMWYVVSKGRFKDWMKNHFMEVLKK